MTPFRLLHRFAGMIVGLAINDAANGVLAFRNNDMNFNGFRLAEAPETTHSLIP